MEIVLDQAHFYRCKANMYAKALNPIAIPIVMGALTTIHAFA
jgi:hypothetical protein